MSVVEMTHETTHEMFASHATDVEKTMSLIAAFLCCSLGIDIGLSRNCGSSTTPAASKLAPTIPARPFVLLVLCIMPSLDYS